MGAPCPTLSSLGGIGITIAEIAREAGDQISWRDPARGQKCRVSAPVSLYDDGVDASRSSHGILCERSRKR